MGTGAHPRKRRPSTTRNPVQGVHQMLETLATIIALAGVAILPYALLEIAARAFGIDTRDAASDDRRS